MNDRASHGGFGVLPSRQVAALFVLAVCVVTGVASGGSVAKFGSRRSDRMRARADHPG
jgi:hypothetical protein